MSRIKKQILLDTNKEKETFKNFKICYLYSIDNKEFIKLLDIVYKNKYNEDYDIITLFRDVDRARCNNDNIIDILKKCQCDECKKSYNKILIKNNR